VVHVFEHNVIYSKAGGTPDLETPEDTSMFLRDFVYVDLPAETVRRRCWTGVASEWLGPLVVSAAQEGPALRLRVGPLAGVPAH
jgi:hypothetical protein